MEEVECVLTRVWLARVQSGWLEGLEDMAQPCRVFARRDAAKSRKTRTFGSRCRFSE
jgi:hypothetical protein